MISSEHAAKLVAYGVPRIGRINDVLLEADDLRALNDRELAVVVMCYAASLAKLTQLNLHDFLGLSGAAYLNVEITKTSTDGNGATKEDPIPDGEPS